MSLCSKQSVGGIWKRSFGICETDGLEQMIVVVSLNLQHFAHKLSGLFRAKDQHLEALRALEALVSVCLSGFSHFSVRFRESWR